MLSAFVADMRKRPGKYGPEMMASTLNVRLQFLKAALNWAVAQKMLPKVPTFPTVKVPKKAPQPIPTESVEKLLAHAQAHKLAPTIVRVALAELAGAMSRDGDANAAARVVRYLDAQQLPASVKFKMDAFRQRLPQSNEVTLDPWDRASDDPAVRLPKVCGN